MTLIEELEKWKEDLKELEGEKIKAETRLEQAMETLSELGFDSVEAASAELKKLEKKKLKAEEEARELIKEFEEKYADFID